MFHHDIEKIGELIDLLGKGNPALQDTIRHQLYSLRKKQSFYLLNELSDEQFNKITPLFEKDAYLLPKLLDVKEIAKLNANKRLGVLLVLEELNKSLIKKSSDYAHILNLLPKKDQAIYQKYIEQLAVSDPEFAAIVQTEKNAQRTLTGISSKKELVNFAKKMKVFSNNSELLKQFARKVRMLNFSFSDELALLEIVPKENRGVFFDLIVDDLAEKADTSSKLNRLLKASRFKKTVLRGQRITVVSEKMIALVVKKIEQNKIKLGTLDFRTLLDAASNKTIKLLMGTYLENPQVFKKEKFKYYKFRTVLTILKAIPKNQRADFLIKNNLPYLEYHSIYSVSDYNDYLSILELVPLDDRMRFFKASHPQSKEVLVTTFLHLYPPSHQEKLIALFKKPDLAEFWYEIQQVVPGRNCIPMALQYFQTQDLQEHQQKFIDVFLPKIKENVVNIYILFDLLSRLSSASGLYLLDKYTNSELYSVVMAGWKIDSMAEVTLWFHQNENKLGAITIVRALLGELELQGKHNKARLFQPADDIQLKKVAYETLLDAIRTDNPTDIVDFNTKHPDVFTSSPLKDIYQWMTKAPEAQPELQERPDI